VHVIKYVQNANMYNYTMVMHAGGQEDVEDPYSWGYCYIEEQNTTLNDYCVNSTNWPCVAGKQYYGRGPIQLR
jgi:hypothetical protein